MTETRPREQLLSAAKAGYTELQNLFRTFRSKFRESETSRRKNSFVLNLSEILQELDKKQLADLWDWVSNISVGSIERFAEILTSVNQADTANESKESLISLLQNVCSLCQATAMLEQVVIPNGLLVTVRLLHGLLLDLDRESQDLARSVCTLLKEWWKRGLDEKHELCLHVLVYLLAEINASDRKSKANSPVVTDLYQIHQSLKEFDMSDVGMRRIPSSPGDKLHQENVQELRQLLVSVTVHPMLLKTSNGRKFLSFTLGLHEDLMASMHKAILDYVLVKGNEKHAEAFGNIYFQAWILADEEKKHAIEDVCIQEIMYKATLMPREKTSSHSPFRTLQDMLRAITCHKGSLQVGQMISRLYEPIIWRSLKAINAMVRANAASLLFDAFPLLPAPDSARHDIDDLLQQQFDIIDKLLVDDYPQVRSIVVYRLCHILHDYWDIIPAAVIANLIKKLYLDHAFDTASADVREAVFNGTVVLLDNPCSHPILKKLLPTVAMSLHDVSEKVRVAFCNMLLAVRNTNNIPFWDVCPLENIVAQLEVANPTVTRRLSKLLTGSFLPPAQSMQVWVLRCVNFYERNPNAARKFYIQAGNVLTCNELGEFILMICTFVCNNISESLRREEGNSDEGADKEQAPQVPGKVADPSTVAGLVETLCILNPCFNQKYPSVAPEENRAKDKKGPKRSNEMRELAKRVAVSLPNAAHLCFKKFHDERTMNALLCLCSQLQPASMPVFSKGVFPKLRSLPDGAPTSYYSQLIRCLVEWDRSQQILELIAEWLDESMNDVEEQNDQENEPKNPKPRRSSSGGKRKSKAAGKKKKTVQFSGVEKQARPAQALRYLECIAAEEDVLSALCDRRPLVELLNGICATLQKCTLDLNARLGGIGDLFPQWTNEMLVQGLKLRSDILSFFAVRQGKDDDGSDAESPLKQNSVLALRNFLEWAQVEVVGNLKSAALVMQDQNSTLLSTSSLNATSSTPGVSAQSVLRRISLTRQCLELVFSATEGFLNMGIPLTDAALAFMAAFTETGIKTVDYVGPLISLIVSTRENVVLDKWVKKQDGGQVEDKLGAHEETIFQVLDDVLLALMTYSRRNPNGFSNTFRTELKSRVRSILQSEFELRSDATEQTHPLYCRKVASALLADMTYHITNSTDFQPCERVADLPQFCASLLPLLCHTSGECDYICRVTLPAIAEDPHFFANGKKQKQCGGKAMVFLTYALTKDSKNPTRATQWLEELQKLDEEYSEAVGLVKPVELVSP